MSRPNTPMSGDDIRGAIFEDHPFVRYRPKAAPNPIVSWNQRISEVCLREGCSLPSCTRCLALLHSAVSDAISRQSDDVLQDDELLGATVAGAASEIMTFLFPKEEENVRREEESYCNPKSGLCFRLGRETAKHASDTSGGWGASGGSGRSSASGTSGVLNASGIFGEETWDGKIPNGPGKWRGSNPISPSEGRLSPMICRADSSSTEECLPTPCGGISDMEEIQSVIDSHNALTPCQVSLVHKWRDSPIPSIWNSMLNHRISVSGMGIPEAAKACAYLNVALRDSCIACWKIKFDHWTARPCMRIPNFKPIVMTPETPSFVSSVSALSATAAAVMSELFPTETNFFWNQAKEAAASNLWAGLNFPQDCVKGFDLGCKIGEALVRDMRKKRSTFIISDASSVCRNFVSDKGSKITVCMTKEEGNSKSIRRSDRSRPRRQRAEGWRI